MSSYPYNQEEVILAGNLGVSKLSITWKGNLIYTRGNDRALFRIRKKDGGGVVGPDSGELLVSGEGVFCGRSKLTIASCQRSGWWGRSWLCMSCIRKCELWGFLMRQTWFRFLTPIARLSFLFFCREGQRSVFVATCLDDDRHVTVAMYIFTQTKGKIYGVFFSWYCFIRNLIRRLFPSIEGGEWEVDEIFPKTVQA